ncbi:MAG: hypothetical protein AB1861_22585 [Cyanobacteriota bacterium]
MTIPIPCWTTYDSRPVPMLEQGFTPEAKARATGLSPHVHGQMSLL